MSASGVIPCAWSLDHVGPMTSTVMDAALMLQVIAGYDPQDPGSIDLPVPDYAATIAASTSSLRLGIPRAWFYEGLHPDIQSAMESALSVLKRLTRSQRDIAPLATDGTYASVMNPAFTIVLAETYEYHKDYALKNPQLYQASTLKRIRAGADATTPAYVQSPRQLDQIRHSVVRVFDDVDLVITLRRRSRRSRLPILWIRIQTGRRNSRCCTTPGHSICWGCRQFPFLVVSPRKACRSGCRSAAHRELKALFFASRMLTSEPPNGTSTSRHIDSR